MTTSRSWGFSLRNATARVPPDRTVTSRVHRDVGEHLAPELGQIVVHDGDRGEAGVDHLEHVIVFEDVGGAVITTGGLPRAFSWAFRLARLSS